MQPVFYFSRYRFYIEAIDQLTASTHWGNALRGLLGTVWKKNTCTVAPNTLDGVCESCPELAHCSYGSVFSPMVQMAKEDRVTNWTLPRPYALLPGRSMYPVMEPGSIGTFDITLVGKARLYLPEICKAFACGIGLGSNRGRYHLKMATCLDLEDGDTEIVYTAADPEQVRTDAGEYSYASVSAWAERQFQKTEQVALVLYSPLVLGKKRAQNNSVQCPDLLKGLLRLFVPLSVHYCGGDELDHGYRRELEAQAQRIRLSENLEQVNIARSSRDRPISNMNNHQARSYHHKSGYLGYLIYHGNLTPILPYLALGQYIQVGGDRTVGMGAYRLRLTEHSL